MRGFRLAIALPCDDARAARAVQDDLRFDGRRRDPRARLGRHVAQHRIEAVALDLIARLPRGERLHAWLVTPPPHRVPKPGMETCRINRVLHPEGRKNAMRARR